jgi:DNA-binding CsgD family transcriptional regulator
MKLMLAAGDPYAALSADDYIDDGEQPAEPFGTYLGLTAIAAAAAGDIDHSLAAAQRARSVTSRVDASYYSLFADVICRMRSTGSGNDVTEQAAALIRSAANDQFLDAFVVAYRSFPAILRIASAVPTLTTLSRDVVAAAGDDLLGRVAGLTLPRQKQGGHSPVGSLTLRENQVLALLAQGFSNAEIARTLVISPSTAKVHVRHILRKLGARTRVEAALAARDVNHSGD